MWAYNYPHNVLSEGKLIPGCEGQYCYALEIAVFPTAFYEVVVCLLLFGLLWALRKKMSIPGLMIGAYLLLNGIERYLIQQIRVEKMRELAQYDLFGWKIAQAELISLLLIAAAIVWTIYVLRKPRQENSGAEDPL